VISSRQIHQISRYYFFRKDFVEILERNKQSLLGALFYIVLPPPPLGHLPIVL
jgi:hypothetical protein